MGVGTQSPPDLQDAARAMGVTRTIASRMNLAEVKPRPELASTTFCLANEGKEYLVYQPNAGQPFSMKLVRGKYNYQWFSSTDYVPRDRGSVDVKDEHTFKAQFEGEAVLLLKAE
jgi:hypothetical protein